MRQQRLLIILGFLALCAASLLGVLVYQTTHLKVVTGGIPIPPIDSLQLVRSVAATAPLPEQAPIESSLSKPSAEVAVTPVQVQSTASEEITKPIFYEVRPSGLGQLSEDQQKCYAASQQEYMTFYNQWVNTWPHDLEAWNKKLTELQQDLAMRIGPDGMDNLLK